MPLHDRLSERKTANIRHVKDIQTLLQKALRHVSVFLHTLDCVFDAIPNVVNETCCSVNGWRGCGEAGGTNQAEMTNFISFDKSTLTLVTLNDLKDS